MDLMVGDLIVYPIVGRGEFSGFILEICEWENRVDVYWFNESPPFSKHIYLDGYGTLWFKVS